MTKVLVSLSGGADSVTLLYDAIEQYGRKNVGGVYFYYGQRHSPGEQEAINAIADCLLMTYQTINVDLSQFGRSPLTDMNLSVPAQEEKKQGITVVPYRNTMFLVMAAAKATVEGFDTIALGATYEDLAEYPDCRPVYFDAMQKALRLADRHHHLRIWTPYVDMRKRDVIALGKDLYVPYEFTHTCYEGVYQKPCRKCDACKEREQSFLDNGIVDPLLQL